jgi:hypothetical protein
MNWLNYFTYNRDHRMSIDWAAPIDLPHEFRKHFVRSLQTFQIGESGEGRHLRQRAAQTGDPRYIATIDLFIKEEQEHARLMAEILKRVQAPLLTSHWSDACFILLRRLFGLKEELLVLLIPEMIAKRYFKALHEGTELKVLRQVFAQICHDEEGHVAFHTDYLNQFYSHLPFSHRVAIQIIWRFVFRVACLVVLWDHRQILKAVGETRASFWNECGRIFDETAAGIFSPPQVLRLPLAHIPVPDLQS